MTSSSRKSLWQTSIRKGLLGQDDSHHDTRLSLAHPQFLTVVSRRERVSMNPAPPSLEATWSLEIISGQPRGAPDIQSSPHLLLMAWKPCCGPSASQFIISQTFTDRGILFTLLTSIIRLQSSTSLSTCVAAATCGNGFFHGQYSHLRLFTFSPRGVARGFCRSPKASPTIPWTLLTVSMVSHSFTLGSRSHQTFCQSLSTVSLSR